MKNAGPSENDTLVGAFIYSEQALQLFPNSSPRAGQPDGIFFYNASSSARPEHRGDGTRPSRSQPESQERVRLKDKDYASLPHNLPLRRLRGAATARDKNQLAFSYGTLIALAADTIVMSDSSELGPIDPQFLKRDSEGNLRWYSVLNYLQAYETICDQLRDNPNDLPTKAMLSKLDPTTVVQFQAIRARTRKLAEQHLHRWMFHERKATYTKIAGELMDLTRWPAHGQMIGWEDAKEMGLEIEYLAPDTKEWRAYWGLFCQQRLAVKDGTKLFESDYASLPM